MLVTSITTAEQLRQRIGEVLSISDWIVVDQTRINTFADATGDHYWIHTDVDRSCNEGAYGTTIAHGFLSLSLLAPSCLDAVLRVLGGKQVLNYGVEHARFIAPVRCGKKLRWRVSLAAVTDKPDGRYVVDLDCRVEIDGEEKPALLAHSLMLIAF
jgi:acyl dehydratase